MTRNLTPLLPVLWLTLLGGCSPSSDSLSHAPSNAPHIVSSSDSAETATAGQQLTFEVVASDPQGSALDFYWSATTGTLGIPVNEGSTSRVTWTAPACAVAGNPPTITVIILNGFQISTTQDFTVTGLPVCVSKWSSTGSTKLLYLLPSAVLLKNGKVLVGGSVMGDSSTSRVWEVYDPTTGTWSQTGPSPLGTALPVLLADGRVLGVTETSQAQVYDPATNTWSTTGSLSNGARGGYTLTLLLNGKVLAAGGVPGAKIAALYDPATGTWSRTGAMMESRYNHAATLLPNGKVLAAGGSGMIASAELYDPATETWSTTNSMTWPRQFHNVTLLLDGKVLVSGGLKTADVAESELYDPATGSWSTTGTMLRATQFNPAVLLSNGQVLVPGGGMTSAYATTELYDPATGSWSATDDLPEPREHHVAILLATGQVLVVGGLGADGYRPTSKAFLYTP